MARKTNKLLLGVFASIVGFMLYLLLQILNPPKPATTTTVTSPFPLVPPSSTPNAVVQATTDITELRTNGVPCTRVGLESHLNQDLLHAKFDVDKVLESQFREDRELLSYFNGICGGTYIEMGALNGKMGSNTYVFNQVLGWKGLLIELSPSMYGKGVAVNRPNELATVNAAVCKNPTTLHFYDAGELRNDPAVNGIWEFSKPEFRRMFWKDATIDDCKEVRCSPFQTLIDKHIGIPNSPTQHYLFDILSLDIEGAELEALETLDFTRTTFGMIVVENGNLMSSEQQGQQADDDNPIRTLLESNGYVFLRREHINEWYINSHFGTIYQMD